LSPRANPQQAAHGSRSGFYQQQVAKVKDVLSAPLVREEYEVSIAP
jgi:hypothetical protein